LASINGRAKILSPSAFNAEYPSGKILRTSSDYGKVFICRRGCNTRTATYTDEFIWEDVYHGGHDLNLLIDRINSETNATRQKRKGKYFDNHTTEVYLLLHLERGSRMAGFKNANPFI
jgi:origin recognition complex subunit 1